MTKNLKAQVFAENIQETIEHLNEGMRCLRDSLDNADEVQAEKISACIADLRMTITMLHEHDIAPIELL